MLRLNTFKLGDEQIGFEGYVDRMKEGQNDIYCITGEIIAAVSSSSFREHSHKKGHEVLYVADPVDEYAVQLLKESWMRLKTTTKEGLDLGDQDERKTLKELNMEPEPPRKLMKETLGDKVYEVIVSNRMGDTLLRALTKSEHGWSTGMQRNTQQPSGSQQHQSTQQRNQVVQGREGRKAEKREKGEKEEKKRTREENKRKKGGQVEKEKGRKGERGKKGGREAEEEECKQVEKDVTGWTEVTRKKRRKTVQIFVKMNGSTATPMEVNLTNDKVEDVLRQVQNDEDVNVTMQGKALRMSDELKSCGVTDGCTIQVTSRLRGGGEHKDMKGQKERKRAVKPKGPEQESEEEPKSDEGRALIQMDEVLRRMEENEEFQKIIDWMSEGSEGEVQQKVQNYMAETRMSWMNKEIFEHLEGGVWRAVEARRKEKGGKNKKHRRQEEQEQIPGQEQGKEVRFGEEEEQLEETRAESTDEPEVTGRLVEVRTGRVSAGLVRGGDERHWADESSRKGKGKGNGGKGEHGSKGGAGSKGTQQVENLAMDEDQEGDEEDERGRVALTWGRWLTPPGHVGSRKERRGEEEARVLIWADCNDEEEKETGEWEMTEERPQGLEEAESELKTQEEEKPSQVESEQEAQEEDKQSQVENDREALERRRAQEALEEEKRAHEAREQKRAQDAREDEERRAQEAREEQKRAQEAREQTRAQKAREEERRREKRVQEAREREKRRLRKSEKAK